MKKLESKAVAIIRENKYRESQVQKCKHYRKSQVKESSLVAAKFGEKQTTRV